MRLERAAHWAEILGNVGVIVTLVILIIQIAETQALESQAIMQRNAPLTDHVLGESPLRRILAKIKEVDGPEPQVEAFMDRYDLSYEEAATWGRHVTSVWISNSLLEGRGLLVSPADDRKLAFVE